MVWFVCGCMIGWLMDGGCLFVCLGCLICYSRFVLLLDCRLYCLMGLFVIVGICTFLCFIFIISCVEL